MRENTFKISLELEEEKNKLNAGVNNGLFLVIATNVIFLFFFLQILP